MTVYLRYSTMWWKVHGPAGKIFKLKESFKKSGGDFNFFFGVWIFSLIVLYPPKSLKLPTLAISYIIFDRTTKTFSWIYFWSYHCDIFKMIFNVRPVRLSYWIWFCDKNPSLSGVRYPGFLIEWIFYWIESS